MAVQDNGDDASMAKAQATEGPEPHPAPPTPAPSSVPEPEPTGRLTRLRRLHLLVKEMEPWGILLAVVALVLSLITTVEERTVSAWQLLTTQAPGNSGKVEALEYLNNDDGFLCAEFMRGYLHWLHGNVGATCLIRLKAQTHLTGIDLSPPDPQDNGTPDNGTGDPSGTYLEEVNLKYSDLSRANLRSANLTEADLTEADLTGANLTDADLREANLSGADLTDVTGLTQEQLDQACGDKDTKLPAGLTIPPCGQEPAP